jgi:hypothetical protein
VSVQQVTGFLGLEFASKQQTTTALRPPLSTAKAVGRSCIFATSSRAWALIKITQDNHTSMYEDNTACIEWRNSVIGGRKRAKLIDIRKHFAHKEIRNGQMNLIRVATAKQLADILTKQPLFVSQWQVFVGKLSLY